MNDLVQQAHIRALERLGSFEALKAATRSNIVLGRRKDRGFHYIPNIDVSIQNIDAGGAWQNTLHLAKQIQVLVEVEFEWREVEGAAHPGKKIKLVGGGGRSLRHPA